MNIYCVKCKSSTETKDLKLAKTKNNRPVVKGTCSTCGRKKCKFLSKNQFQEGQKGEGILGNLLKLPGGKIPFLSDLPLVGALF